MRNKYVKRGPSAGEIVAWAAVYILGGALLACAAIGYASILTA